MIIATSAYPTLTLRNHADIWFEGVLCKLAPTFQTVLTYFDLQNVCVRLAGTGSPQICYFFFFFFSWN